MCKSGVRFGLGVIGVLALAGAGAAPLAAQGFPAPFPAHIGPRWEGHRTVESASAGEVRPHSWIRGAYIGPEALRPVARSGGPNGFWPIDMQTAYGVNAISGLPGLSGGLTAGGAGVTVAIVDAYDSPSALADLNTFSTQFGLPTFPAASGSVCAPSFTKVSQTGSTSRLPRRNSGWEVEINLDVQWVHSIAPCANILLVEATSSSTSNLLAAVTYAGAHAKVVSMSWGGGEFSGESSYDSYFQNSNVVFMASSGDTGGIVEWPSVSGKVVGVGGTNLPVNSSTGGLGTGAETAWNGSGGGCSTQEPKPSVQTVTFPTPCSRRGAPDVAASGGPNSAVAVYISRQGGWYTVYGTSLACPMWAGMVSIADSLRAGAGKLGLTNATLADVYNAYASSYSTNYTDITSGSAGSFTAVAGWDFVTGLGSPKTYNLVPYLVTLTQ